MHNDDYAKLLYIPLFVKVDKTLTTETRWHSITAYLLLFIKSHNHIGIKWQLYSIICCNYVAEEEEESHHASHELSKDFSCLAGLLGLKTLKTLKFAAVFKKLKMIAIFFIAFKLGVLLSPVAIPLLFPVRDQY